MIFNFIKASHFFPLYCPDVTNWINKSRGINGRGNPCHFTREDLVNIEKGLMALQKSCLDSVRKEVMKLDKKKPRKKKQKK